MATLEERKAEYILHESSGKDYYNSFRSQLTLDVENGDKTLEEAIEISKRLESIGDSLNTGDWKSAYKDITGVLPNIYCPQSIIDSIKTDISTYIQTNYTW